MIILIGFLFNIAFVFFIGLLGTNFQSDFIFEAFLDYPSILLMLLSSVFYLWITNSFCLYREYFVKSFAKQTSFDNDFLRSLSKSAKNFISFVWVGAGVVALASFCLMLHNLSDPSTIGPKTAIAMVTLLYSASLHCFVLLPLKAWADKKLDEQSAGK